MNQLPIIKRKVLEKMLVHMGFKKTETRRSHALYRHEDGRVTTIPFYRSNKVARPLIRLILKDINVDDGAYCSAISEVT